MKQRLIILMLLITAVISCVGCERAATAPDNTDAQETMYIGKMLNISLTEPVDAEHLQQVADGTIETDVPYFDLYNDEALANLIKYMKENDYKIMPGEYEINQSWGFEDGLFIVGDKKQEILKFGKKNQS